MDTFKIGLVLSSACLFGAAGLAVGQPRLPQRGVQPAIDVLPGKQFNQFLPGSRDAVEVAVLTGPTTDGSGYFDAMRIAKSTIAFGPGRARPLSSRLVDIDGDGDFDMVFRFDPLRAGLTAATHDVAITGIVGGHGAFFARAQMTPVTTDPNDSRLPTVTYYSNATDSRLLTARRADGIAVDYYGARDTAGRPTSISNVRYRLPDGRNEDLAFDAQKRPRLLSLRDGSVFRIEWVNATRFVVTYTTPLSDREFRTTVDAGGGALRMAPVAPVAAAERSGPDEAWAGPWEPAGAGAPAMALTTLGGDVNVRVTRCGGQPVNDASVVEVIFTSGFTLERRVATFRGDGMYVARLPIEGHTFFTNLGEVCGGLAETMGLACDSGGVQMLEANVQAICGSLQSIAQSLPPQYGGAAATAIAASCPALVEALNIYCETFGQGAPGGESLADILCARLTESVDAAMDSDNELSARAVIPSPSGPGGFQEARSQILADVPINVSFPQLNISFEGLAALGDARTAPVDPAPRQNYVFTVGASCIPPGGVSLVLSISGTDGYTNTRAVHLDADGTGSLSVPGGAAGVIDTLTATMFQYNGGQILSNRTITITF